MFDPGGLERTIRGAQRLVIFLHDNPDPDAIAAGWLLADIAAALGVRSRIVYGGQLARAENRAMVSLLRVPLRPLGAGLRHRRGDGCALVDTQPGTGNNSFVALGPRGACPKIVIDHHPPRAELDVPFADVRTDEGCTTTLLLGYHQALGLTPDASMATAAAYAILSETQDLEREATRFDREAYQRLFPLLRLTVLGRIRHPRRDREYYRTIARALSEVAIAKHLCLCHIGPVPNAELVAEVADFLVAMQRITWSLVSGLHQGNIVVSLRTRRPDARAFRTIQRTLGALGGKGGGHGMIAGGLLPCPDPARYPELADEVSARFLHQFRATPDRLRRLLDDAGAP
jgi:nanoRNase/pAp phosphatase (c-di-AMP/oligoRNAs hydrolase)